MVGGAMSGYCAMGSVESAMTPMSVITMLITPAKIGRSMKKCGKFMPRVVAAAQSFFIFRLRGAFLCVRAASGRLLRNWLYFHAGLQELQTSRNNFLAVLQPAFHNPFSLEDASSLEVAAFDGPIRFYD